MKKADSKEVISREAAIEEFRDFLNAYTRRKTFSNEKIEEDYPDAIEAVQLGLLVFNEKKTPTFTLETPIKSEEGTVVLDKVVFRTRIKPSTKADLASGIDLRKDSVKFALNIAAYIVDQPRSMLDKFEPFDYDVIQQVGSVFS